MFSGILDPDDYNVKLIKHIIMKKFYFAFCCALMAATCAMAAPLSGDRIMAAQMHAVEWNDVSLRPTVDEASFSLGYKTQLSLSEDENVLILSDLCDGFYIPVHVDYATGKAWIETGMPLDAYTDQSRRDVVRTIYALPEQCLVDAEADMNTNLFGSILEDGSIAFDGGIVFLVSESMAAQDLAAAGDASETVWMSSPLFSDICLLVPNAIHQFRVGNDSDMSLLIPKKPFSYIASMQAVRSNFGVLEEQGFRPRNPNGPPPVCNPGSGNNESAAAPDGNSTLNAINPNDVSLNVLSMSSVRNGTRDLDGFRPRNHDGPPPVCNPGSGNNESAAASDVQSADLQGTHNAINNHVDDNMDLRGGFKKKKKDDAHSCGVIGDYEVAIRTSGGQIARILPGDVGDLSWIVVTLDSAGRRPMPPPKQRPCRPGDEVGTTRTPVGEVAGLRPFNGNDFPWDVIVIADSAGRKPIKPSGPLHGCSEDPLGGQVAFSRTPGGQVASAPNHENDNIEAGYKPKKRPPVNGCSEPPIWLTRLQMAGFPTRDNSTPSVASSKPADEEFSVPVYVFQNPDDNTITVYNLYGSGYVMTCMIVPEERKMSIADVTEMIDHLLTAGKDDANQVIDDVNGDGKINIDDVTTLIDTLLNAAN